MTKRRKAITGEFKNEVLHFGKLIVKQEGLLFFNVKIEGDSSPDSLAVVLDSYAPDGSNSLTVGSYASIVNSIAALQEIVAPIIELGMAPDNKPFLISESPVGGSLDQYLFSSKESLIAFFKKFWVAYLAIEEVGVNLSYLDSRNIYVESAHPIIFPSVRSLVGGDLVEELLGLVDQDTSFRVFKTILANSLFLNSDIIGHGVDLEDDLMRLAVFQMDSFLDNLVSVQQAASSENTFDLNSFDEVGDFKDTLEDDNFVHREEDSFKPVSSLGQNQFKEEWKDPELGESKGTKALSLAKRIWTVVIPIIIKICSKIISILSILPKKVKIGLSVLGLLLLVYMFGLGGENVKSSSRTEAKSLISDVVPEESRGAGHSGNVEERENEVLKPRQSEEVEDPRTDDQGEDYEETVPETENIIVAPKVENKPMGAEGAREGMRSKQTAEDLDAIQSLKGPLKKSQIGVLVKLSISDDFEVRIASIRALGELAPKGDDEVKESLLKSLSDSDYLVRGFAVSSITAYLEEKSVPILEQHRANEESEIVMAAIDRAIKRLEFYKKRR